VTVRITDNGVPILFGETTFTWDVSDTNRAPLVGNPGDQSDAEGDAVSLALSATDPDGDSLTWSASGLPSGLSIDPDTGTISGTVGFAAAGMYSVTVSVVDDGTPSLGDDATFTWTVSGTNQAPNLGGIADRTDAEGDGVSLALSASDPDGDDLTWSATGLPGGLSIDPDTGRISGTVSYTAAGVHTVTVAVTDDGDPSLGDEDTFTWTIADTNRAPIVADPGAQTTTVDAPAALTLIASDPDGDDLTWSISGLPPGLTSSGGSISGTPTTAGSWTVTITATDDGDPQLSGQASFVWTIEGLTSGGPDLTALPNRYDQVGDIVGFTASATHPDGEPLSWSATGLPPGISVDPETGEVSGTLEVAGIYSTTIRVTDPAGLSDQAAFLWHVTEADPGLPEVEVEDQPPHAEDDSVEIGDGDLGDGSVAVSVLDNDSDPESAGLVILGVSDVEIGTVTIAGSQLVFTPPPGWAGTTTFTYQIADPAGNTASALVTIRVVDNTVVGGAALTWTPPAEIGRSVEALNLDTAIGTELVLGTVFQSLYVLRMPLALLGAAVLWSLLLGGMLSVGFAARSFLPFLNRKATHLVAIVMERHGGRVPAHTEPGEGEVIWRFNAADRGIPATGRHEMVEDVDWVEVDTPEGRGWVEAARLTEQIDATGFADDDRPLQLLGELVEAFESGGELRGSVSERGLWVVHHDAPVHYPPDRVSGLLDDPEIRNWRGRNPAYPDHEGTFASVVAQSVLSAWRHPQRDLAVDQPAVPSTVVPVEYVNFHAISIGADLQGRERLDQTAWMAVFDYQHGEPSIVALLKEG
jgi:hypothetical protein